MTLRCRVGLQTAVGLCALYALALTGALTATAAAAATTTTKLAADIDDAADVPVEERLIIEMEFDATQVAKRLRGVPHADRVQCVAGHCDALEVQRIRCRRVADAAWNCAIMAPAQRDDDRRGYRIARTDVVCQGYAHKDDPFVLPSGCSLEYAVERVTVAPSVVAAEAVAMSHAAPSRPDSTLANIFEPIAAFFRGAFAQSVRSPVSAPSPSLPPPQCATPPLPTRAAPISTFVPLSEPIVAHATATDARTGVTIQASPATQPRPSSPPLSPPPPPVISPPTVPPPLPASRPSLPSDSIDLGALLPILAIVFCVAIVLATAALLRLRPVRPRSSAQGAATFAAELPPKSSATSDDVVGRKTGDFLQAGVIVAGLLAKTGAAIDGISSDSRHRKPTPDSTARPHETLRRRGAGDRSRDDENSDDDDRTDAISGTSRRVAEQRVSRRDRERAAAGDGGGGDDAVERDASDKMTLIAGDAGRYRKSKADRRPPPYAPYPPIRSVPPAPTSTSSSSAGSSSSSSNASRNAPAAFSFSLPPPSPSPSSTTASSSSNSTWAAPPPPPPAAVPTRIPTFVGTSRRVSESVASSPRQRPPPAGTSNGETMTDPRDTTAAIVASGAATGVSRRVAETVVGEAGKSPSMFVSSSGGRASAVDGGTGATGASRRVTESDGASKMVTGQSRRVAE